MRLHAWFHDGWFLFSVIMSVMILMFLALPSFFGFQNFVQWGAMYDDRWCTVIEYDKNPHEFSDARMAILVPGSDVRRVYSAPTHNRRTCLAQARMRCGKESKDGWLVTWAEPEFQHIRFMGTQDVCAGDFTSLDYWFYDGK